MIKSKMTGTRKQDARKGREIKAGEPIKMTLDEPLFERARPA